MNELLMFIMFGLNFSILMALYRFMGKKGLLAWVPIATILANIQVLKLVTIFGFTTTLGNAAYASMFLASNILSENYGAKDARLSVMLGFITSLAMSLIMYIAILFTPATEDVVHSSIALIFKAVPRIVFASLCAYLVSSHCDIILYKLWKEHKTAPKWLWLRSNCVTLFSQFLDSLLFCTIAFWGKVSSPILFSIIVTTYLFKVIGALLDTPFTYLAVIWFKQGRIKE